MIIHALQTGTPFLYDIFRIDYCIRSKCTSDKYLLFTRSTRLQSMYNHMVGRTASVRSPFYSLLSGNCWMGGEDFYEKKMNYWETVEFKIFRLSLSLVLSGLNGRDEMQPPLPEAISILYSRTRTGSRNS